MRLIDADEIVKQVYKNKGYNETVIEWLIPSAKMEKKENETVILHTHSNGNDCNMRSVIQ